MSEEYKNYGSDLFLDCNDRCRDINEVKEELQGILDDLNIDINFLAKVQLTSLQTLRDLLGALAKRKREFREADELAEEVDYIRDEGKNLIEIAQLLSKKQTEIYKSLEKRKVYMGESNE